MSAPLTADVCARAVLAAAAVLGVEPDRLGARHGPYKQPFTAAALALSDVSGRPLTVVGPMFGCHHTTLSIIRSQRAPKAMTAARAARDVYLLHGVSLDWTPPPGSPARSRAAIARRQALARAAADETVNGGGEAPAPAVAAAAPRVDHTTAIREAMRRRKGVTVTVAGVETDAALLPARQPGECAWPLGDLKAGTLRACGDAVVQGRMYCAAHLKAAGLKPTARPIETVGRVARPYAARDLGE